MTFSIVARCARTGEVGVAVATALPGVGGVVPHVEADIGAVVVQYQVNPRLAAELLQHLRAGETPEGALRAAMANDTDRAARQIGIVGLRGLAAMWSGAQCPPSTGHVVDGPVVALGNTLAGPDVVRAMARSMKESAALRLAQRVLLALEAGEAAGGDRRGLRSAALKVGGPMPGPLLDLRVDDDPDPVRHLRRALDARLQPPTQSAGASRMSAFASRGVQAPQATLAPPLPGAL